MPTLNSQLKGDEETVLFALPASQYCHKVIAALDHLNLPYRVVICDGQKFKEQLEPPHTVPQLRWKGELIVDSADIMERLAKDVDGCTFFPAGQEEEVKELDKFVQHFNGFAMYQSWWPEDGFRRGIGKFAVETTGMGWLPGCLQDCVVLRQLTSQRARIRGACRKLLGAELVAEGDVHDPKEDAKVEKAMLEDTKKLEEHFKDDAQLFLIPGATSPTAADFTLFGVLQKLVGFNGDSGMDPAAPWLWEKAGTQRLKAWNDRMIAAYPLVYFGKYKEAKVWAGAQPAPKKK